MRPPTLRIRRRKPHSSWYFGSVTKGMRVLSCWVSVAALVVGCSSERPIEDVAELKQRLAEAASGDSFLVGSLTLDEPLTIPAGVTLRGEGAESVIELGQAGQLILATAPALSTRVASLSIESRSHEAALAASGGGIAKIDGVNLRAERGIG